MHSPGSSESGIPPASLQGTSAVVRLPDVGPGGSTGAPAGCESPPGHLAELPTKCSTAHYRLGTMHLGSYHMYRDPVTVRYQPPTCFFPTCLRRPPLPPATNATRARKVPGFPPTTPPPRFLLDRCAARTLGVWRALPFGGSCPVTRTSQQPWIALPPCHRPT